MSPSLLDNPRQLPRSPPPMRKTRRDSRRPPAIRPRQQVVADMDAVAAAKTTCQLFSGNDVMSCYPNASTTIYQNEWSTFVWNSRLPQYAQTNMVNIYLFHGDSGEQVLRWIDFTNPTDRAGALTALVNDSWWGTRGTNWNGQNLTYDFYWVITPNGQPLGNSYLPQTTFAAVQTTYADSVLATLSPSSSSSPTPTSRYPTSSITSPPSSSSSTQSANSGSVQADTNAAFPHWAIAVIVVLGFFAILATCVLAFVILRRIRRRRGADLSHRGSVGSSTPMMAETITHAPSSPLLGGAAVGAGELPSSAEPHDGASVISRTNSAGDSALFSGADAAIMADAFRKALRKPEFSDGTVEDESQLEERKDAELLNRELAEEGRDIRNVSSSRGVRVETLSDDAQTRQAR